MSIVKLSPAFKDYLWGGSKLKSDYNKKTSMKPLAESWEISTHPDGQSTIVGQDVSMTLSEYIAAKGRTVLGTNGEKFEDFPLLVKFIDAKKDLSIQVHPNDEYALKNENEYGKTEMWYVLEAEPGSTIYYGLNKTISKKEFQEAIENNNVLSTLNKVEVKKGDVIFVEAGTIHAIGAGIVVCEIQQNSNITYRVYDFQRKGIDGKLRDLHIPQSVEVSNLEKIIPSFQAKTEFEYTEDNKRRTLVDCDYFKTDEIYLQNNIRYSLNDESFQGIVVLDGALTIKQDNLEINLIKGETAFIAANTKNIELSGKSQYLSITI